MEVCFFPLLVFIAGWSSIWTYCPLGTEKEPDGGEVIKLLTYNTQDIAAMRDYDREQGNPVLNYCGIAMRILFVCKSLRRAGK